MIRVNGREVYNNMFQDSVYVGNCYNAVTIGASSRQQVVEVFMKLPFSVRFESTARFLRLRDLRQVEC